MNTHKLDSFSRALVGFDTLFSNLEQRFVNSSQANYPPHNVIKTGENSYRLQVAVTGFEKTEIRVEIENGALLITGERHEAEAVDNEYIYKGLATRNFVKQFALAEFLEVESANIKNGVLSVNIVRNVPEAKKARTIDISNVD